MINIHLNNKNNNQKANIINTIMMVNINYIKKIILLDDFPMY